MTTAPDIHVDPDVVDFYTRYDENVRLTTLQGQLQTIRLRYFLSHHLPSDPGRIADIGGGPGGHAVWMQEKGHSVDLLDPVPQHAEAARAAGVDSAIVGDARSLPYADESYDLALLAGPLYHLSPAGRVHALREARRIVKPTGVVAAVAINRYANLMGAAIANQVRERSEVIEDILEDGYSPANDRQPHMYYHTPDELQAEFTRAGLAYVNVLGLTGPGGWLFVVLDRHIFEPLTDVPPTMTRTDPLEEALAAAKIADDYPDLTAASSTLLAIGYRSDS